MTAIANLPNRPLRQADLAALDDDNLQVAPYGGVPEVDEVHVYALKIASAETAYALGFDDSRSQWQHLASVDAVDLAAADTELDAVLDEWAIETFGEEFEVLKPL